MDYECIVVDDSWGPWAGPACRGGLDFTLLFEDAMFSILPTAVLVVIVAVRVSWLRRQTKKTKKGLLLPMKLITMGLLALLRFSILLLWALQGLPKAKTTLASSVIYLLACLPLCIISYYEHVFSVSPSKLVELYLLITAGFDIIRTRTLWLLPGTTALAAAEAAALGAKITLAIGESWSKFKIREENYKEYSGEQLAGLYGSAFFLWLGETLWNGYRRPLGNGDLLGPQDEESSEQHRDLFRTVWEARQDKSGPFALILTLFRSMPQYFFAPIIPKAAVVAIMLAQPLLLERMLDFVQGDGYGDRKDIGYSLIGAFALVYGLTGVFNAWYAHTCNKLALELRSQLIDAIYRHLLELRLAALDSGNATTLINVDLQHIMDGSLLVHDIWASFITVAIAMYLLYTQIQLAFIAPLLCALVMTFAGGVFGGPLGQRQVAWLTSTENRVKATLAMIGSFKELKMLGISEEYLETLQKLRWEEVQFGRRFRRIISIIIALSAGSTELSILVTYGAFAIISKIQGLQPSTQVVFTSLALLRISLDPLFLLIQGTPSLVAAFKCLGRIQEFLNDNRLANTGSHTGDRHSGASSVVQLVKNPSSSETSSEIITPPLLESEKATNLVALAAASFSWKDQEAPALHNIDVCIAPASFTAIVGPVGSGKSTLIKAILGEVGIVSGRREIHRGSKFAFCDQQPWLLDRSVKENIVGSWPFDAEWYNKVIEACALARDISLFSDGDATGVGSQGSALSGGQCKRVALARAIYCKPELILLDDVFSGLDRKSAQHVFDSLLSETGLLAELGCAVVLVTHTLNILTRFDKVLVMSQGVIIHQGRYKDLLAQQILIDDKIETTAEASEGTESTCLSTEDSAPQQTQNENSEIEAAKTASDWSIYVYFIKSAGIIGISVFLVLAALLAGERSFENIWLKFWSDSTRPDALSYYMGVFTALIVGGLILLYGLCYYFFDHLLATASLRLYLSQLETLMRTSISYVVSIGSTTLANRFIQDIMLIDDELPMAFVNTTTSFLGAIAETIVVLISSSYLSISLPVLIGVLFIVQKFYLRTSKQLRLMDIEAKAPLSAFLTETLNGVVTIRAFRLDQEFTRQNAGKLDHSQKAMYMLFSVQVWLKMILDFVVGGLAIIVVTLAVTLRDSQSLGFLALALVNLISLSSSFKYLITFWAQLETSIGAVTRIKRFTEDVKPEEKGAPPLPEPQWPSRGSIEFENVSATYSTDLPDTLHGITVSFKAGTKVAICGRSGSGKSSLLSTLLRCLDITSGTVTVDGQDITLVSRNAFRKRVMTLPQKGLFIHGSIRENMTLWADDSRSVHEIDADITAALRKVGLWDALFAAKDKKESPSKVTAAQSDGNGSSSSASSTKEDDTASSSAAEEKDGKPGSTDAAPVTLDTELNQNEMLSYGQQQLFCLARSLFQRGNARIVVMDEFTSSMDNETETVVRQIVRRDLRDRTVLEVIHRLEHILDFDLVVVIDQGRIAEVGAPAELLQKQGGQLRGLWESEKSAKKGAV